MVFPGLTLPDLAAHLRGRWAAAHPDLARSLLRYPAHWDPFEA